MNQEEKIIEQCAELKKAMEAAMDKYCLFDEEITEKFYKSSFSISYNNKITGETHKIDLCINPEFWELMEQLTEEIPELLKDYL